MYKPKQQNIRQLMFYVGKPRMEPVGFESFTHILHDFLSFVHPDMHLVLYGKYVDVIVQKTHYNFTCVSQLFNITHNSNTNKLYYIERGWSEEHAKQKVYERQSSNSIATIMKRYNITRDEATQLVNSRSVQGLLTKIENVGGIDNFKKRKREVFNKSKFIFIANKALELNMTLEEAQTTICKINSRKAVDMRKRLNIVSNTTLQYYLNKGLSIHDAYHAQSNRQRTFSLEICIDKHGIDKGTEIWKQRQSKWLATMDAKTDEEKARILKAKIEKGAFVSQESINFFQPIIEKIPVGLTVFTGDNEYYINSDGKFWKYDFTILELNLIIEYNGIHVHPKIDSPETWRHVFTKQSKQERLLHDSTKLNAAIKRGFSVIDVWSDDDLALKQQYLLDLIETKHKEIFHADNN